MMIRPKKHTKVPCKILLIRYLLLVLALSAFSTLEAQELKTPDFKELLKRKKNVAKKGGTATFSKRIGVLVYEGYFDYSFMEERDGTQYKITDENPTNNFTGIKSKFIIVKLENFTINKNQDKGQYKMEFACTGELNGLQFETAAPHNYLSSRNDVVYLYYKPMENNKAGFIELNYKLYKQKKGGYELIESGGGIRQNYNLIGIGTGLSNNTSRDVTVGLSQKPQARFDIAKSEVEVGEWIQITNTSQNATQWQWEFDGGDPANSDSESPFVSMMTPGKRRIKLTASNESGSSVFEKIITVVSKEEEEETAIVEEDLPSTGKELFEEVAGVNWETAVEDELVKESDYRDFQTASEIQDILEQNKKIIPRVKQNEKGNFTVEFDNAMAPLKTEVLNNNEGVLVGPSKGTSLSFVVSDGRDHEVRVEDERGQTAIFVLPGSVEQLLAKLNKTETHLEFSISGGRKPYFVELANLKSGFSEEFPLGECVNCKLSVAKVKEQLKKNFGQYEVIIKDKSKSFQNKLSDTFEYKAKSTRKLMPIVALSLLALVFVILMVVVVLQNKK